MKTLLQIIILLLLLFRLGNAEEDYLEYNIPENAERYGPIATRESEVTYTKYFKKGSNVENDKALIGVEYHRNGILIKKELYKEGKLHGVQKKWHFNGVLEVEAPYKKGVMEGGFQHWNSKGQLVGKYEMKQGAGLRLLFSDKGHVLLKESYKLSQKNGFSLGFDNDGKISYWIKYKNDKITGYSFAFWNNGGLQSFICFSPIGDLHGVNVDYNFDGSLQNIEYYLDGNKVSKEVYLKKGKKGNILPLVYENSLRYKDFLSEEIKESIKLHGLVEIVKIPLEFDENGSIITVSGKPFLLPK